MDNTEETYGVDYHVPVLVDEVIEQLEVGPGGSYIDGTAGGGGHSEAILDASSPDGRVLAIDRDPEAIEQVTQRLARFGERATVVQGNYGSVADIARLHGFAQADGFLVDAGVSSHQLDEADRGFTYRDSGPLDMRMGPDAPTARDYLARVDQNDLADALYQYGEIRSSRRMAAAIKEAMAEDALETTGDLAGLVEDVLGHGGGAGRSTSMPPATLVFQAIRIAVNRELDHLERAVQAVPDVLRTGGMAAFISFHSLEDRIVKHGFRDLATDCVCPPDFPVCGCDAYAKVEIVTRKPMTASDEELARNPRARSAKLRIARVIAH
ncbi:MAG: 16S rRNA (cytosine(1402)-N(4))-methyltransferase RsmH [Myxococcota bacterium]